MKLEKWSPEYSVRISELDHQHQKLIELIVALEEGSKNPDYVSTIRKVLDELMEYVLIHFHTEEEYMASGQYEGLEAHKKLHESLAREVNDRVNEIISREPTALDVIKLHNFLLQWLKHHIMEEDKAYVAALEKLHDL